MSDDRERIEEIRARHSACGSEWGCDVCPLLARIDAQRAEHANATHQLDALQGRYNAVVSEVHALSTVVDAARGLKEALERQTAPMILGGKLCVTQEVEHLRGSFTALDAVARGEE